MFQYWLDKGIDGFRMDATKFIFENASFPDEILKPGSDGTNYELIYHNYTNNQPETFQLLTQWTDMLNERVLRDGRPKYVQRNELYKILILFRGRESSYCLVSYVKLESLLKN